MHWANWLAGAGALYLVVNASFPSIGCRPEESERVRAKVNAAQLVAALNQYQTEYASLPTGWNAQILAALRGNNPKKIVFFECKPELLNAHGELLDPWKMPYRIDTSDAARPKVYSFGKDKQDNGGAPGSDDITSWQ